VPYEPVIAGDNLAKIHRSHWGAGPSEPFEYGGQLTGLVDAPDSWHLGGFAPASSVIPINCLL